MKSVFKKIKLVLVSALVSTNLFAQNDMSSFLKVGIDDGNKVLSAYATPIFKTFGLVFISDRASILLFVLG